MTPQQQLKDAVLSRKVDYSTCKKCETEIAPGECHYFAKADVPFTDGPYHLRCCPPLPVNA